MPQPELQSAQWLIKQYGSGIGQIESSICASTPMFKCAVINGVNHITEMYVN
ncbi:hypothetical protein DFA_08427 [Cavenderia fasciculata]|uniref:Uncharacterized protein n=1 Tax=Cavenderia fasciculata TaxID=261658 RepID=F4Q658_CACFS|nr:uncharacterized protein DFA_08427 [Cavenderia fasciculata]EGG17432.1 hypothetical protein DFA_08427 [Cavenderia fasciculata]|eukprot:XP_004355916.1 hypothetical protein DFA_08427 [Cavenderia fasciculata]